MGGAILIQWLEPEWLGYHLAFTPLLAYLGFFIKYRSFSEGLNATNKTMTYIGIGILVCTLVGMVFLFRWSERPNTILFSEKSLVIDGPYGLELAYEDILDVRPLGVLPEITVRTNGIATGKASKGKFKDAEGQKYLLLIDHPAESYVLIERVHGEPLIVSLQNLPEDWMIELLEKLDTRE
jgi:hypothetical protein